jgi:hypothetical protein
MEFETFLELSRKVAESSAEGFREGDEGNHLPLSLTLTVSASWTDENHSASARINQGRHFDRKSHRKPFYRHQEGNGHVDQRQDRKPTAKTTIWTKAQEFVTDAAGLGDS